MEVPLSKKLNNINFIFVQSVSTESIRTIQSNREYLKKSNENLTTKDFIFDFI